MNRITPTSISTQPLTESTRLRKRQLCRFRLVVLRNNNSNEPNYSPINSGLWILTDRAWAQKQFSSHQISLSESSETSKVIPVKYSRNGNQQVKINRLFNSVNLLYENTSNWFVYEYAGQEYEPNSLNADSPTDEEVQAVCNKFCLFHIPRHVSDTTSILRRLAAANQLFMVVQRDDHAPDGTESVSKTHTNLSRMLQMFRMQTISGNFHLLEELLRILLLVGALLSMNYSLRDHTKPQGNNFYYCWTLMRHLFTRLQWYVILVSETL